MSKKKQKTQKSQQNQQNHQDNCPQQHTDQQRTESKNQNDKACQ